MHALEAETAYWRSYVKTRDDFPSKDAYDDYLEAVEDISEYNCSHRCRSHANGRQQCIFLTLYAVYKLTYNVDVAEVEQQVQDYIRQQASGGRAAE